MMKLHTALTAAALLTLSPAVFATDPPAAPAKPADHAMTTPITKEHAIEMALKAHPGKVTKAYEDTKKGKKTWEVKIEGTDGKKWEVYYEIATGQLVAEESK